MSTHRKEEIHFPQDPSPSTDPIALTDIIQETEEHFKRGVKLAWGRRLQWDPQEALGDRLTLYSPEGKIELQIVISEKGPVLQFQNADLQIHSPGRIQLECEAFHVHAH